VQFPAAFLAGLGAPWNTLQPSGRLVFQFDRLQWTAGYQAPPAIEIGLKIQMLNIASRVATLPVLGHYELDVRGGPGELALKLDSRPGSALRLEGQGRWRPGGRVEFRGEASASAGREEALSNLLNIIGRRDGPRSVMAIGAPSGAAPPSARTP
jgi:general secretion pathway protein N